MAGWFFNLKNHPGGFGDKKPTRVVLGGFLVKKKHPGGFLRQKTTRVVLGVILGGI